MYHKECIFSGEAGVSCEKPAAELFSIHAAGPVPTAGCQVQATKEHELRFGKRYDDTDLLLMEILENPFDSQRSQT
jgi:hypothetical protein